MEFPSQLFNLSGECTYGTFYTSVAYYVSFIFPGFSNIKKILIRANSKDWLPPSGPAGTALGKQQHIAWICTELFNTKHDIIQPQV